MASVFQKSMLSIKSTGVHADEGVFSVQRRYEFLSRTVEEVKKAKKWQSRKDSNLNKMNQNHLCYRYTTGLRTVHNIRRFNGNAS